MNDPRLTWPESYYCHMCGASGCKLWRSGGTHGSIVLQCADCASLEQRVAVETIDAEGFSSHLDNGGQTSDIGHRIAAVPVNGTNNYWGATSFPLDAFKMWQALPTRGMIPKGTYVSAGTGNGTWLGLVAQTFSNHNVLVLTTMDIYKIVPRQRVKRIPEDRNPEYLTFRLCQELREKMGLPL